MPQVKPFKPLGDKVRKRNINLSYSQKIDRIIKQAINATKK